MKRKKKKKERFSRERDRKKEKEKVEGGKWSIATILEEGGGNRGLQKATN